MEKTNMILMILMESDKKCNSHFNKSYAQNVSIDIQHVTLLKIFLYTSNSKKLMIINERNKHIQQQRIRYSVCGVSDPHVSSKEKYPKEISKISNNTRSVQIFYRRYYSHHVFYLYYIEIYIKIIRKHVNCVLQ